MNRREVSIGLPVYNGSRYLRGCVDSLLAQEFTDFELIICDNASTDDTEAICRDYAERDKRVRYYRNQVNMGAARNHRRVFELSESHYFKWAAHDDESHPLLLSRCMEYMRKGAQKVVLVYPRCELIDENGLVLSIPGGSLEHRDIRPHRRLARVLYRVGLGSGIYGVMRRGALEKTRLIDSFFASDYVLLAELAMLGEIRQVPEPLLRLRIHAQSSLRANVGPGALQQWLDPLWQNRHFKLPTILRLPYEYSRSVAAMPLTQRERLLCFAAAWIVPWWKKFRGACGRRRRRWVKSLFGSTPPKDSASRRGVARL